MRSPKPKRFIPCREINTDHEAARRASRVVAPDDALTRRTHSPRNCGTGIARLTDRFTYGCAFTASLSAGGRDVDSDFVWAVIGAFVAAREADCGFVALPFASMCTPDARSDRRLQYSMVC